MRAVPLNRYLVFFSIAIAGCALDLATKSWMFRQLGLPGGQTWWILEDVFGFETSLNEGALFGMGQGMGAGFAALSVVATVGILCWLFYGDAAESWLMTVALGCVTAGIFGNLYDRLGLPGLRWNYANRLHDVGDPVCAVRDWILMMIGKWRWPNFNLADSLLVCGVALIMWHAFSAGEKDDPAEKTGP